MNHSSTQSEQAQQQATFQNAAMEFTNRVTLADESVRGLIKRRPVAALGVALLAGFIIGRIATRL